MPELTKRLFGKKDMFILFADYSIGNLPIRPDGYDITETLCPLGINEHFFYFPYQNQMLEINMLNGHYNKIPCSDVKAAMLEAANENKQILNGYVTYKGLDANSAMTEFLGNYLAYVLSNDAYDKNRFMNKLYDTITGGEFVKGYRLDTTREFKVIRDFSAQGHITDLETYLEDMNNLKKAEPDKEETPSLSFIEASEPETEPEKTGPFLKKYVSGDFDCYCLLVDYNQMALPWPDGFETPEKRVENQAPIGINDNYAFYCYNNQINYLYFGECKQNIKTISNGAAFNRQLLDIAVENEKLENENQIISNLVKLLENMIRIKHGTKPFSDDPETEKETIMLVMALFENIFQTLGDKEHKYSIDNAGNDTNYGKHFPIKFTMTKDGKPLTLEAALDSIATTH